MEERVWILAFDKVTGERMNFASCPKQNAAFYSTKFEMEGYDVKVMAQEEIDEYVKNGVPM